MYDFNLVSPVRIVISVVCACTAGTAVSRTAIVQLNLTVRAAARDDVFEIIVPFPAPLERRVTLPASPTPYPAVLRRA
jgi:hypothetical protein